MVNVLNNVLKIFNIIFFYLIIRCGVAELSGRESSTKQLYLHDYSDSFKVDRVNKDSVGIDLSYCHLSTKEWKYIVNHLPLEIEGINFNYSNYGGQRMKKIKSLRNIKFISLVGCKMNSDQWLKVVSNIPKKIVCVNFSFSNYSGGNISSFSRFKYLSCLNLIYCQFQSKSAWEELILNIPHSLERLYIYYSNYHGELVDRLNGYGKLIWNHSHIMNGQPRRMLFPEWSNACRVE